MKVRIEIIKLTKIKGGINSPSVKFAAMLKLLSRLSAVIFE